jgi:hypothetical protein
VQKNTNRMLKKKGDKINAKENDELAKNVNLN